MATKKVSDLEEGDGITITGPMAEGTYLEFQGRTYRPGDVVTVTGVVAWPDQNRVALSTADVGLVDATDQPWVLSVARDAIVEYHG